MRKEEKVQGSRFKVQVLEYASILNLEPLTLNL